MILLRPPITRAVRGAHPSASPPRGSSLPSCCSHTPFGNYVESCSMFVRGGVYRVVKEAMGGALAKFSVSALMFDYVLTGPISGVSAGQYLTGLLNEMFAYAPLHISFCRYQPAAAISPSCHRLFLVGKHQGHSRIQRESAADHAAHHRDGGGADRLVPIHSGPRRPSAARSSCPQHRAASIPSAGCTAALPQIITLVLCSSASAIPCWR